MESAISPAGATLAVRVAEARVEDIGHAIARLAPDDLACIGAKVGDVIKIVGPRPWRAPRNPVRASNG
jgi:hypothetical protein